MQCGPWLSKTVLQHVYSFAVQERSCCRRPGWRGQPRRPRRGSRARSAARARCWCPTRRAPAGTASATTACAPTRWPSRASAARAAARASRPCSPGARRLGFREMRVAGAGRWTAVPSGLLSSLLPVRCRCMRADTRAWGPCSAGGAAFLAAASCAGRLRQHPVCCCCPACPPWGLEALGVRVHVVLLLPSQGIVDALVLQHLVCGRSRRAGLLAGAYVYWPALRQCMSCSHLLHRHPQAPALFHGHRGALCHEERHFQLTAACTAQVVSNPA